MLHCNIVENIEYTLKVSFPHCKIQSILKDKTLPNSIRKLIQSEKLIKQIGSFWIIGSGLGRTFVEHLINSKQLSICTNQNSLNCPKNDFHFLDLSENFIIRKRQQVIANKVKNKNATSPQTKLTRQQKIAFSLSLERKYQSFLHLIKIVIRLIIIMPRCTLLLHLVLATLLLIMQYVYFCDFCRNVF